MLQEVVMNLVHTLGGPYTRNVLGCFLANFKPLRGNYVDDEVSKQ